MRPTARGALAVLCLSLLVTACGGDDPAGPTSPGPAPAETAAPTADGQLELGVDEIEGVALPADPEEVLPALTGVLGEPAGDAEFAACPNDPDLMVRTVRWEGVEILGPGGDEGTVTGWSVAAGAPEDVVLPHGLRLGMPWEQARDALPEAEETVAPNGGAALTDGGLYVVSDETGAEVLSVNANLLVCD